MEKPNLDYIDDIARGDTSIKKTLIDVIKNEFPKEKEDYFSSLKNKEYKKIGRDREKWSPSMEIHTGEKRPVKPDAIGLSSTSPLRL